jgi:hypothetical protein
MKYCIVLCLTPLECVKFFSMGHSEAVLFQIVGQIYGDLAGHRKEYCMHKGQKMSRNG